MKHLPSIFIKGSVLYYHDDIGNENIYLDQLESDTFAESIEREKSIVVKSLEREIWMRTDYGGRTIDTALDIHMSLRSEKRGQLIHWYAYRRINGKLRKYYAGHSEDINTERIVALARKFEVI
jgi:hypothetical protein